MKSGNIRTHLKQASEEVEHVCGTAAVSDVEDQLTGIAEQLRYVAEGDVDDPEALAIPERGALDTIQSRITEVIDRTENEEVAACLSRARQQLLLVIMTLDDQWKRQHQAPIDDE